MNYKLKINANGQEKNIIYKSLKDAREGLRNEVIHPAKEYIKTLPAPEIRALPRSPRSRKTETYLEHFYLENYLDNYYVLFDRQDTSNQHLVFSGVIVKEGDEGYD